MGVASIRLNSKEEKLVKVLKDHYNCDTSTLVKKSLWELFEELKDRKIIEEFEKKEKNKKIKFFKIEELI